jgi:hypothetical protein
VRFNVFGGLNHLHPLLGHNLLDYVGTLTAAIVRPSGRTATATAAFGGTGLTGIAVAEEAQHIGYALAGVRVTRQLADSGGYSLRNRGEFIDPVHKAAARQTVGAFQSLAIIVMLTQTHGTHNATGGRTFGAEHRQQTLGYASHGAHHAHKAIGEVGPEAGTVEASDVLAQLNTHSVALGLTPTVTRLTEFTSSPYNPLLSVAILAEHKRPATHLIVGVRRAIAQTVTVTASTVSRYAHRRQRRATREFTYRITAARTLHISAYCGTVKCDITGVHLLGANILNERR